MKPLVRWSISNSPAMNIILVAALLVGWFCMRGLRRETFPEFDLDIIMVSVPYPGASPEEVEEGICLKIEEAIRSVEGIKKITSTAAEGAGSVTLELKSDVTNADRVLNDVRSAVDRIPSFPELAEDAEVKLAEIREPVIRVGVLGPERRDEQAYLQLREVGEQIREDLLLLPIVSRVDMSGTKEYQIDIEISEDTLRSHRMSLKEVADVVRRENHEMPGGTIRGKSQEVLLRGHNRRLTGDEIAKLPLISHPDGAVLTLDDLGTVRDEFADTASTSELNGQPVLVLSVMRNTSEDLLAMVDAVKKFVKEAEMPHGYRLVTWGDRSVEVRGRVDLLKRNGIQGLIVVFLLLALFLELRLAFWIALGIPFSLLMAATFLNFSGQTLNMISMFAFIMALGIVVDDAIVVGENIYAHRQMGKTFLRAAIDGAVEVVPSVLAAVLTTVIAFTPLLFVSGMMGKVVCVLPMVIIAMLIASLAESVTILPCHLAHHNRLFFGVLHRVFYVLAWVPLVVRAASRVATTALNWVIRRVYAPSLRIALANRSIFVAGCVSVLILSFALVAGGVAPFAFFPKLDSNSLKASIEFPDGTPEAVTDRWTRHAEDAFWRVAERLDTNGHPVALTTYRTVGAQIAGRGPRSATQGSSGGSHLGGIEVELVDASERSLRSEEVVALWREEVGPIPGVENLTFGASQHGPGGAPIEFKLTANHNAAEHLDEAIDRCKMRLAEFPGVSDIVDDSVPGKWEFRLKVKEEAMAMGVRAADLAETVRATYYGQEVMRLQRGRHEVRLMVRYPKEDRHTLAGFNDIRVRTGDGIERPLTELADIEVVRGYSKINRIDQSRAVTITADVDETVGSAHRIVAALRDPKLPDGLPEILADYPGIRVRWEGQQEQEEESMSSMFAGFAVAMLAMYVLLSIEFKSYIQPILVLLIIPFGMTGAIAGHAIMGLPLTIFSLFGVVALSGIVINDSIVLTDFINHMRRSGMSVRQALVQAGQRRFRPVMLTTVTTVGGLTPILMETSFQAQMLIPMATSIAFGEIFATILVLFLVPVFYSIYAQACDLLGVSTVEGDERQEALPGQK